MNRVQVLREQLREHRRRVLWLVVIVLIADGLEALFGRGVLRPPYDWGTAVEGVKSAVFWFGTAWSVYRAPGKAGFWVGVLGLAGLLLVGAIVVLVWWAVRYHPDMAGRLNELRVEALGFEFWVRLILNVIGHFIVALAALSLRWLYPRPAKN